MRSERGAWGARMVRFRAESKHWRRLLKYGTAEMFQLKHEQSYFRCSAHGYLTRLVAGFDVQCAPITISHAFQLLIHWLKRKNHQKKSNKRMQAQFVLPKSNVQNMQRVPRHWELSNQNDSLLPKSRNALLFEHARSRKCTKGQSSIPSSCWSYPAHTSAYLNLLDRIPETTYVIDLVGVVLIQMTQKKKKSAKTGCD